MGLLISKSESTCLLRSSKRSYTMCAYTHLVHAINTEVVKSIGRKINEDKFRSKPWERNQKRESGVERTQVVQLCQLVFRSQSLTYEL